MQAKREMEVDELWLAGGKFCQSWDLKCNIQHRADDHAPCKPVDSQRWSEDQCAKNNSELIKSRRECRDQKDLMRVQNADDQSADAEEHGRYQLDAQQRNGESEKLRVTGKARGQCVADHLRGEDCH